MSSLFDVARLPFSTYSSWLSLSLPRYGEGLFLRDHQGGSNDLFPIKAMAGGAIVELVIEAQLWIITLDHGESRIEICFERRGTVDLSRKDPETPGWAKQATVAPAEDGGWELAVGEFEST